MCGEFVTQFRLQSLSGNGRKMQSFPYHSFKDVHNNSSMKKLPLFLLLASVLCVRAQDPLVRIETVPVGDPGNAPDILTGYGAVPYTYSIGKYEVTSGQYTAFLNCVASVTTNDYLVNLWAPKMGSDERIKCIERSGDGSATNPFVYQVFGSSNCPVSYVSWMDAARFANWMHNGATNGASTETGAYTLNGATNGIFTVNPGARWSLPSENQWYKAAYYKGGGTNAGYWIYPTQSNETPGNHVGIAHNQANFWKDVFSVTQSASYPKSCPLADVGAFSNSPSAYGTFDQGGSLNEWNDSVIAGFSRGIRGGDWNNNCLGMQSTTRGDGGNADVNYGDDDLGFRLVTDLSTNPVPIRPDLLEKCSVMAWGDNSKGQCTVPAGITNAVQVAAGDLHSVALLANGRVIAWGDNTYGQTNVPVNLTNAVQVAAGNGFSAALNSLGQIIVWGDNTYGQANVPSNSTFCTMAAGEFHLLGVNANGGNVIAWGDNSYGQTQVPTNSSFLRVVAGDSHSLGLGSDGRLIAWGDNTYGQTNIPPSILLTPLSIAAHGFRNIVVGTNGTAVVWGGGPRRSSEQGIPGFTNLVAADAGWYHYVGLRANGAVVVSGDNSYGQTNLPKGVTNVIQVSAGGFHNLALKSFRKGQTLSFAGMVGPKGANTATINLAYGTTVNLSSAKLSASASSGLPVSYAILDHPSVATISTNGVLTPMGVGSATLIASQSGNGSFLPADSISRPVVVSKGTPLLTFKPAATQPYVANGTFPLSAVVSGSLPVSYASANTNVISVSGTTATIKAKGKTTLTASVSGDANWKSNSVSVVVTVK